MDGTLSNHDLKMFYTNERRLFSLLVQLHHVDPTVAVFIIALWLFLEHSGRPDVTMNILSSDDSKWVGLVAMEAESIVEYLRNPAAQFTTGLELTAGLARTQIVISDFAERRSEIVEFMNGVVAGGLRRAFADIHMIPDHALRYLTELVPLSQHPQGTTGTNSSRGTGSGTGLFSITRGHGLFPWTTTWAEAKPTQSSKDQQSLKQDSLRRRSRSPGRQPGIPSATLQMPSLVSRYGTQAGHGGVPETASLPTQGWAWPSGRTIETGLNDHQAAAAAGASFQQPRSLARNRGELLPLRPLQQSVIEPPPMAAYGYRDPVLGWVVLPIGAGTNMVTPFLSQGLLPLPVQGMGLLPVPDQYLGFSRSGREGQQAFTRYQRMEQETMESEDTWSGDEEEEEGEQTQNEQSSDGALTQGSGGRVRTLFVTFSRGFPIESEALMDHFTR